MEATGSERMQEVVSDREGMEDEWRTEAIRGASAARMLSDVTRRLEVTSQQEAEASAAILEPEKQEEPRRCGCVPQLCCHIWESSFRGPASHS